MTAPDPRDPGGELAYRLRQTMRMWEQVGFVVPGWAVTYQAVDGMYRVDFTVVNTRGRRRTYSKTQAQMGEYAMGIADALPDAVGRAVRELAALYRTEMDTWQVTARGTAGTVFAYEVLATDREQAIGKALERHLTRLNLGEEVEALPHEVELDARLLPGGEA